MMLCMDTLSIFVSLYWLFETKFTTTSTRWFKSLFMNDNVMINLHSQCHPCLSVTLGFEGHSKVSPLTSQNHYHNGRDAVSNHQPHDCLLNRLFGRRSTKTWKLRVTGLCAGNSPVTGEFPAQMASNAEYASIWWRHHDFGLGTRRANMPLL